MVRALFGGSFDPVHDGHVALVNHVLQSGLAEVVHVVPAWRSPFKGRGAASPEARLAMVQLALADMPGAVVDPREVASGRSCPTLETVQALQAEYPRDSWQLLIGADNLADFPLWYGADRLQGLVTVVVFGRDRVALSEAALRQAGLQAGRCLTVPDFSEPVSSTAVRAMLATGSRSVAALTTGGIPPVVARYIVAHQLYRPEPNGEDLVADPD